MRILYISQYFPPEAGATQTRAYEMACNWVKMGHNVSMLTEIPNHPSGIIPNEYLGKFYERSNIDGIDVLRVWVKASPIKNFPNRLLFYVSFMFNAIFAGLFLLRNQYDIIYASSPPLFVGGTALVLSKFKRIPLVFEVRDLWPEAAIALGELSNRLAISLTTKLEEICYQKAILVVVVTRGIFERLKQRGIQEEKLLFIPNGANTDMYNYSPDGRARVRKELNLNNKFVLIYAGIFGLAYSLETILEAACKLVDETDIFFLLIGDGPRKADILTLAKSYNLPNLSILPEQPRQVIPDYLSAADAALIPLRQVEILKVALPVKIFDAWSCERPVVLSIDGEASEMVLNVGGGYIIPPEDPIKMVEVIIKMKNNPNLCDAMGKNGRAYTINNHSRSALAENLISHLEKFIAQ
jgi:glycosyltransferase involved in cell wall biosynthesis